jgi:hypothetical protein
MLIQRFNRPIRYGRPTCNFFDNVLTAGTHEIQELSIIHLPRLARGANWRRDRANINVLYGFTTDL